MAVEFTRQPDFWDSLQYTQGSFTKAAKKMKLDPRMLRKLAKPHVIQSKWPEYTDAQLDKLAKAISRLDRRDFVTAKEFIWTGPRGLNPGQLAYAKRYTARGPKEQAYFRRAVKQYYKGSVKRVLMPALSEDKKTVFDVNREAYLRVKKVIKKERKHTRGTRGKAKARVKRAVRRLRRRGHK
jgi:hypothetical protein